MSFTFTLWKAMLQRLSPRWPLLLYAATWTTILTIIVAVASFSPELAFVSAVNPTSSFSQACRLQQQQGGPMTVRVPVDVPGELFCLPAPLFKRSKMDLLVPPVFAAVVVATSAYVVKALALWEMEEWRSQRLFYVLDSVWTVSAFCFLRIPGYFQRISSNTKHIQVPFLFINIFFQQRKAKNREPRANQSNVRIITNRSSFFCSEGEKLDVICKTANKWNSLYHSGIRYGFINHFNDQVKLSTCTSFLILVSNRQPD